MFFTDEHYRFIKHCILYVFLLPCVLCPVCHVYAVRILVIYHSIIVQLIVGIGTHAQVAFLSQRRRETVCKTLELKPDDTSYSDIMQRLVKRYLFKLERSKDETERCKGFIHYCL